MTKLRIVPAMLLVLACFFCFDDTALPQKLCPFKAPVGEAGLRKQKATKKSSPGLSKGIFDK